MGRFVLAGAMVLAASLGADARTVHVRPGDSIQAAVDFVGPGSTIIVEPGTYRESGAASAARAVTVTKDDIRIIGVHRNGQGPVIERAGAQTQGLWVSPDDSLTPADVELPPCGGSGTRIHHFTVRGITVEGFPGFGIYLACVDGFDIRKNTATLNDTYAIFPVRSSHGRMSRNVVSSTRTDACLYVGQDTRVLVDHNQATDCEIGFEIEDSAHVMMRNNDAGGNTSGIIVDVLNGRQVTVINHNQLIHNTVHDNNRANTATEGDTQDILPGIGITITGADTTTVAGNTISGNTLIGLALLDFCTGRPACSDSDPNLGIDPIPDGNRIVHNTFSGNNQDVIYHPAGGKNCFGRNSPEVLKIGGGPLPVCH